MVIGLIADTHGLIRPEALALLAGVDLIVHAGDVGADRVLTELSAIAPVEAVFGNVDDPHHPMLARERALPVGDLLLHVSHGHELGSPTPRALLERYAGDVLVFGHTHRPVVHRADDGRLVINPGAAGPRRFSLPISLARLTVTGRDAEVELLTIAP
jgi:putative phosphoesterase